MTLPGISETGVLLMTQLKVVSSRKVFFLLSRHECSDDLHVVDDELNEGREDSFLLELEEVYHLISHNQVKLDVLVLLPDLRIVVVFVEHNVVQRYIFVQNIQTDLLGCMWENNGSGEYSFLNQLNSQLFLKHSV